MNEINSQTRIHPTVLSRLVLDVRHDVQLTGRHVSTFKESWMPLLTDHEGHAHLAKRVSYTRSGQRHPNQHLPNARANRHERTMKGREKTRRKRKQVPPRCVPIFSPNTSMHTAPDSQRHETVFSFFLLLFFAFGRLRRSR